MVGELCISNLATVIESSANLATGTVPEFKLEALPAVKPPDVPLQLPVTLPSKLPTRVAVLSVKSPVLAPVNVPVPIVNLSTDSSHPIKALLELPRSITKPASFAGLPDVP